MNEDHCVICGKFCNKDSPWCPDCSRKVSEEYLNGK